MTRHFRAGWVLPHAPYVKPPTPGSLMAWQWRRWADSGGGPILECSLSKYGSASELRTMSHFRHTKFLLLQ